MPTHVLHVRSLFLFLTILSLSLTAAGAKVDSAVEADMRARLAKSKLASDGLQVRVQGGVATLSGRTGVVQHKGTATRMAKAAGATKVVNNIQITEEARKAAAAKLAAARAHPRSQPRTERPKEIKAAVAPRTAVSRGSVETSVSAAPAAPAPSRTTPAPPPVRRAQIRH